MDAPLEVIGTVERLGYSEHMRSVAEIVLKRIQGPPEAKGRSWGLTDPALHPSSVFICCVTLSCGALLSEPVS